MKEPTVVIMFSNFTFQNLHFIYSIYPKPRKLTSQKTICFLYLFFSSILNLKMYRAYEFYPILINTKLLCLIPPVCLEL